MIGFLIYKDNNKWNWFENADFNNFGIHSFDSLEECLYYQLNSYIKFLEEFKISGKEKEYLTLLAFEAPPRHIDAQGYINFCLKEKKVIYAESKIK